MLFNSFQFLIFFPTVVLIYFLIPHKLRWILLLVSSYYFYMCWKPEYIILIIISTLIDYFCGILMGKTGIKKKRRKYLILSLFSNLGLLFVFKYFNFFSGSVSQFFESLNIFINIPYMHVLLPIGISFYTFQTISYTIEVYCGNQKPEKHLGIFAVYVSFFPQLVAGPIERSVNLIYQFRKKINFDYDRITNGLKLMDNFKRPYFARSISDFWRRWHISLSTWFRDYLYIPLGGNRVVKWKWYFNLSIVFLICGLWHGAKWTFVLWGGLHGFYLIFSIMTRDLRKKIVSFFRIGKSPNLHIFIRVSITFTLVLFAWIFFRANSTKDAFYIITHMFADFNLHLDLIKIGFSKHELLISILLILFLGIINFYQRNKSIKNVLKNKPLFLRWGLIYLMIFTIILFGEFGNNEFIYFQF